MKDTKKMLRAIINGQSALKQDLLKKIDSVDIKVDDVKKEVKKNAKRIGGFGLQLAKLSDDAPTIEEFDKLDKRVSKVEQAVASN